MPDTQLVDPLGIEFTLHEHTWQRHILANHPDMGGGREFVERAITTPLSIRFSLSNPDVRVYYYVGPKRRLMVVEKADIKTGIVLTAHLANKMTGGLQEWP